MHDTKNILFLLGGHDLEMLSIREIFEEHQIPFADRQLKWGAKLSAYRNLLNGRISETTFIYGIELTEDLQPPANYRSIDHHNERSNEPSSIEQVAKLIGITLDR